MNQKQLDILESQRYAELKRQELIEHGIIKDEPTAQEIAQEEMWQDYYREAKLGII